MDNSRLWLLQQLEKMEISKYASMKRLEVIDPSYNHPTELYSEVTFYDPHDDNNKENRLSTRQLQDGHVAPHPSDDDVESILSYSSVQRSERSQRFSERSADGGGGRRRITSSGTTVGRIEDEEVKMEVDDSPSPTGRHSRGRSCSKRRSDRSSSVWLSPDRRRGRSRERNKLTERTGRSKSRGRNDDARGRGYSRDRVQSRGRSRERGGDADVPSRNRRGRSWAKSTKSTVVPKQEEPRNTGYSTYSYNSFSTGGNTSNIRNRSRAKSVADTCDRTRARSVSNVKDRSRAKSVTALIDESTQKRSLFSVNTRYRCRSKSVGRSLPGAATNDDSVSTGTRSTRKRTLSGCSNISGSSNITGTRRGERGCSVSSTRSTASHRSLKSNASSRSYQLDKFRQERAAKYQRPRREKFIDNDFTSDYEYTTTGGRSSIRRESISSNGDSTVEVRTGIQLSNLYALWVSRRSEFLEARRKGELHLMYGPEEGYLCGMCFKKFSLVVDLQMHCEELLHYACITCGRFFNTYTALGQHCNVMRHTKD